MKPLLAGIFSLAYGSTESRNLRGMAPDSRVQNPE